MVRLTESFNGGSSPFGSGEEWHKQTVEFFGSLAAAHSARTRTRTRRRDDRSGLYLYRVVDISLSLFLSLLLNPNLLLRQSCTLSGCQQLSLNPAYGK